MKSNKTSVTSRIAGRIDKFNERLIIRLKKNQAWLDSRDSSESMADFTDSLRRFLKFK